MLEFGSARERIWGGFYNFYLGALLPSIGRLISHDAAAYSYLSRTVLQFPTAQEFAKEMSEAGLSNVGYRKLTGGIVCLHWGYKSN